LNKIPSWAFAKSELFFIDGLFGRDVRRVGGYSEADPRNKKSVVDDLYKKNEEIITEILSRIYNEYNSLTSGVNNIANVLFYYAAGNNKKLGELLNNINSYSIFLDRLSEIINSIEGSLDNIEDNNFKRNILNELENKKRIIQNLKRQIENYKENLHNFIENVYQNRYVGGDMMKFGMDFYNNLLFLHKMVGEVIDDFANLLYGRYNNRIIPLVKPAQEVSIEEGAKNIAEGLKEFIKRKLYNSKDKEKTIKEIIEYLPNIVIENSYAGAPATRPDLWKRLLNNIREEIVKEFNNDPELREIKNKIEREYGKRFEDYVKEKIGATLDVGHLKLYEKYGYKKEDILKWVEEIKPEIKHLHIHETQWGADTHLPLGTGWDDVIASELEKIKDILSDISIVHEPGGWYVNKFSEFYGPEFPYYLFSASPTQYSMANPMMYTPMPYGGASPFNQYIQYTFSPNPYEMFSRIPVDLGGSFGKGGRRETFTGAPLD
ncbi:MAG: hypothetical protein ACP5G1_04585, partial [Nanopusillaceae archaeon]